jgi:ABC-2 type transport system ATP-binding protein
MGSGAGAAPAVETTGLTKYYGRARGVLDLSLRVERGEIFGFLGPNGAGKTTTIRSLLGYLRPTRGTGRVLGLDVVADSVAIHRRVGYLPSELALYPDLTARDVITLSASLRGDVSEDRIADLARRLDVDLGRPMRAYSHGNRQKIGLVLALMHRPDLLILDEPTNGLDPLVQQTLYDLLHEHRATGGTVFFSSHVLPEVERLCDRVAIVREGRLVAVETVAGLKEKALRQIEFVFAEPVDPARFREIPGVVEATAVGSAVRLAVHGSLDRIVKTAAASTVQNVLTYEPSLEEIFLAFYRDAEPSAGAEVRRDA